ncbi:MAG: hypothetical protein RML74_12450 [Acidobacteriota bacterium]|nr:hypothetical protein [Acidobacteriota bacterium]
MRLFANTYYRLDLFTAYEFLERRFSYGLRAAASLLFILLRLCWLATAIYATAVAVSQIAGISLPAAIFILGGSTCLYTALGGMRAVIWTDVAQFLVFTTAILAMSGVILKAFQWDIGAIWALAEAGGRTGLANFSFSLQEVTLWNVLIGYFFINLASYGVDQVILQQYLTAKNIEQSRRSLWANAVVGVLIMIPLFFLGLGFYAFYTKRGLVIEPDRVIPHFAITQLPEGLSGLVIAGIFAATMSSISSGITAITTATIVDFYQRALRPQASASHYVKMARFLAVLWGTGATILALFIGRLGTIAEISLKTNSFFTGVLLGIFLLGVLVSRANHKGAITRSGRWDGYRHLRWGVYGYVLSLVQPDRVPDDGACGVGREPPFREARERTCGGFGLSFRRGFQKRDRSRFAARMREETRYAVSHRRMWFDGEAANSQPPSVGREGASGLRSARRSSAGGCRPIRGCCLLEL